MAKHLCIVARDNPLLLGYLHIALEHLSAKGDQLEIVFDRRPDPFQQEESTSPRPSTVPDQRRIRGMDDLLRSQGYAIVTREAGMSWQLNDGGEVPAEELDAVDMLAEEDATRVPGRRRTLLSALALAAAVIGVAVALPRDSVHRLADGLASVADRGTSWLSASVNVPRTAPSTAPPAVGGATAEGLSSPAPVARTPPAAAAALQAARAAERAEMEAPRSAEPPRPAEPPRAVEPPRAAELPRVAEPTHAVELPRALASARAVDPPRSAETPRAAALAPAVEAGTTPAGPPKPAEFAGLPRFEMTRERDALGRTAAITVRVTDTAGRPLPAADVWIRREFTDGAVRETQLAATPPAGSYRGPLPNTGPNTNGLVMRILLGDVRYEVPLAE